MLAAVVIVVDGVGQMNSRSFVYDGRASDLVRMSAGCLSVSMYFICMCLDSISSLIQ